MEARRNDIVAAVDAVDAGDGVVILTDMFGGTPSNLAISVMQNREVEVIAGVNLPMLVKLARVRPEMPIKQAVHVAAEAGRKYIYVANDVLGAGQA
jgi:PTS system mannose-specific IIA component